MSATLSGWHITIRNCYLGGNCAPHCKDERKALYILTNFFVLSSLLGYCFERLLSHRNDFYTCFTNLVKKNGQCVGRLYLSVLIFSFSENTKRTQVKIDALDLYLNFRFLSSICQIYPRTGNLRENSIFFIFSENSHRREGFLWL